MSTRAGGDRTPDEHHKSGRPLHAPVRRKSVDRPHQFAGRDNDLKALAAQTPSNSSIASDPAERADALRHVPTSVLSVVGDKDPIRSEAQLPIETVPNVNLSWWQGKITSVRLRPKHTRRRRRRF